MAAAKSGLENIMDLIGLFAPKGGSTTKTSGSATQTESTKVDPKAVQAAMDSILGGTQGLAAVAQGQKTSGLYNSTTNQLLTNDLLARTAAEGAKLNSTKTVSYTPNTTTVTTPTAQISPKTAALGGVAMLGASLFGPTLKAGAKKFGLNDIGADLANSFFGSSGSSSTPSASAGDYFSTPAPSVDFGAGSGMSYADVASGGNYVDFGVDVFNNLFSGGGSSGSDDSGGSSGGDFFSSFFANGGRVPSRKKTNFYADGGVVDNPGSNVYKFAANTQRGLQERLASGLRPERLSALNYKYADANAPQYEREAAPQDYSQLAKQLGNLAKQLLMPPAETVDLGKAKDPNGDYAGSETYVGGDQTNFDELLSSISAKGVGTGVGTVSEADARAANAADPITQTYNKLLADYNNAIAAANEAMYSSDYVGAANDAYSKTTALNNFVKNNPNVASGHNKAYPGPIVDGAPYNPSGYSGTNDGGGGGTTDPNAQGAVSINIGGGSGTGSGGSSALNLSPYPEVSFGYANGGRTSRSPAGKLPGHDTSGSDKILAHLSGGEYIIPTDSVDLIGEDVLDQLVAATHTPIGGR